MKLTHFLCHSFGLLSVLCCEENRKAWRGKRAAAVGQGRQFQCRDCAQAKGVSAGTEPTLISLGAVEKEIRKTE